MPAIGLFILTACATGGRPVSDEIDAIMRSYEGAVPGASLVVIGNGVPLVRRSWGFSDVEARVAATPETNYRLASVTKQFTAAAVLLLLQDGKLSLNDSASKWLPSLPKAAGAVTLRQLLTHTSGIIDYEGVVPAGTTTQLLDADVLRLIAPHDSTYFRPGTSYRYSNSAYALLALVVEHASGKSFATFLRERIFLPLGMNASVAYEEGVSGISQRAFGYTKNGEAWTRKDQSLTSAVLGDGGIYSSVDDLAKWDAALYDSRLLNDESRRVAFAPQVQTDEADVRYGFGWRITGETLWHSGETSGFRNVIVRYPARRLTVVILTNRDDPGPYATALEISKLVL